MKKVRRSLVSIKDLKVSFFVRQALNQDHVLYLAGLKESGVKFDPIKIDKDGNVIDGRHRIEAYLFLDILEIDAEVYEFGNELEKLKVAFTSNTGGSLPPTTKDFLHMVRLLLDKGVAQVRVHEYMGIPVDYARKLISRVKSEDKKVRVNQALNQLAVGNLSLSKVAEIHNIPVEDLKARVSKTKGTVSPLVEFKKKLSKHNRSSGQKLRSQMEKLLSMFEEGNIPLKDVEQVLGNLEQTTRSNLRTLGDWRARFNQKNGNL